jgi:hypothetical protein
MRAASDEGALRVPRAPLATLAAHRRAASDEGALRVCVSINH